MSGLTEQFSGVVENKSVLDLLREYYHVPALAFLVAFSLWIRTQGWRDFLQSGQVLFSGNDAWYHFRMVQYTVGHWPFTMPFDPWTHFPQGTSVGQFGTLYDQIVATAALVIGLGSPTQHQVAMTLLFAPAVFGALTLVPAYYLGKRVSDRPGALIAVVLLTLTTGQFLTRGLVGFSDHHIAEVFFHTLSAAAIVYALTVAHDEKPVYELVAAREWDALKRPVGWGALVGLFVTLYLWTWPPGVFLVGILGVYFAIAMSYYLARGESPEHVAFVGVTAGVVVGVLTLLTIDTTEFTAVALSLLQPALGFGLALGCVSLAALARFWDERDLPDPYYPITVAGVGVGGALLFSVAAPGLFDYVVGQVLRIFGHTATAESRTVAEAQPVPLSQAPSYFFQSYGLAIYTALAGFLLMLYRIAVADEQRPDHLFVVVWSVFLLLAALTQRRFDYYFAVSVAVTNAYLASRAFALVNLDEVSATLEDLEAYQVMAVLAVLILVAAPLLMVPTSSGARPGIKAKAYAEASAGPGSVTKWTESLEWMQNNTPAPGTYGTGGEQSIQYYGTYQRTENFQYQDGTYGTLAWWDYGHWITVIGHRIPNANPFQQGAHDAANVLLSPNESYAYEHMRNGGQEETRYVVVDYPLGVAGTRKFAAPAAWETKYGLQPSDIARTIYDPKSGRPVTTIHTARSYESLRVRLYQGNGGRMAPPQRNVVVVDYETTQYRGQTFYLKPQDGKLTKQFANLSAARDFVRKDGDAQIGGFPGYPPKPVPALEHYRLVHASESSARTVTGSYPWVKVFERVPGATIRGEGPANATVTARVTMKMLDAGGNFTYTQQVRTGPDGQFTMTVPYSTTGYEKWGPKKGYTNVSVRAKGPYTLSTRPQMNASSGNVSQYVATVNVSEAKVIGEDDSPIRVELEKKEYSLGTNDGSSSNGSDSGGSSGSGGGSGSDSGGSSGSDSGGTSGSSDGNATGSLAPPARRTSTTSESYAQPARP